MRGGARRKQDLMDFREQLEPILRALRSSAPPRWQDVAVRLAAAEPDDVVVQTLGELVEQLEQQQEELSWHRAELSQTNAGLLALHSELDQERRHNAFLDDVSRASATSLDSTEMCAALVQLLRARGVADAITMWTLEDGNLQAIGDEDAEPAQSTRRALATGEAAGVDTARLSVPLTAGPRSLGVLDFHRVDGIFGESDLATSSSVAVRVAVGLRNINDYKREHELAERLQRAMLPRLMVPDELDVVARYRSATSGVQVGGDWFDAVTRPDGSAVLTVGDVTGHGLDAAVVMGRLQNALNAYALEGHRPALSLQLVHDLLRSWDIRSYATAVVVEVDVAENVMRWASAGHPPPLLDDPHGGVRYLEGENASMLGVPFHQEVPEHEVELSPRSSVVLYSDGLIERRTEDIDTGLARLAAAYEAARTRSPQKRAEHLLSTLLNGEAHEDDVCLLICQLLETSD
ncbi:SpoIIE family protein phosphatase [Saccharopolyspora spinosa]